MVYLQSLGYPTNDPNVNRAIEETVAIVNDIDQRVQALKIGISQALPNLTPALFARDIYTQQQLANRQLAVPTFGNVMASQIGALPFANPALSPFASQVALSPFASQAAISPFATAALSPFGPQAMSPLSAFPTGLPVTPIGALTGAHLAGVPGAQAWPGVTSPFVGSPFRTY